MQAVVIGSGPAGISAALYIARGGMPVTVIGKDGGALMKTKDIENYYGFAQPVSGARLVENGLAQARRLGAVLVEDEVVGLSYENGLVVSTAKARYTAGAVVMATGASRAAPRIPGLAKYEGKGVSYCAVCDAFFFKGKDVAVLGDGDFARHEVLDLLPVVNSVTVVTNGAPLQTTLPPEVVVRTEAIERLDGGDTLAAIHFKEGGSLPVAGLFVALGVAGSSVLARKMGAAVEGTRVVVDSRMQTSIPGLFAAGDCTGGLLQIAKAVHEGAVAGIHAVKHIKQVHGGS